MARTTAGASAPARAPRRAAGRRRPRRRSARGAAADGRGRSGRCRHQRHLRRRRRPRRRGVRSADRPRAGAQHLVLREVDLRVTCGTRRWCPARRWCCGRWRPGTSCRSRRCSTRCAASGAGSCAFQAVDGRRAGVERDAAAERVQLCAGSRPCSSAADSIIRIIELFPRPVLGPMTVRKLGKPAAVQPRSASMPSFQCSASVVPSAPVDAVGDRHVGDVEAGAEDDRVDLALGAVGGDQRVAAHLRQAGGDHVDVGLRQRRVVAVGQQDALAADAVVGGELGPQRRVLDGAACARRPASRPGRARSGRLVNAPTCNSRMTHSSRAAQRPGGAGPWRAASARRR